MDILQIDIIIFCSQLNGLNIVKSINHLFSLSQMISNIAI